MGLSIHYKGKLKKATELALLIDEVKEIAITKQWRYFVFEDAFQQNSFSEIATIEKLYGIMITPPESEPLCFSFLSNGRMCGILNYKTIQINQLIEDELTYQLATKTQYAGPQIHKELILLMDYVSEKYLINFECQDEGQFWETRDENLLNLNFKKYTNFIDSFSSSMEMIPINEDEKIEDYIMRISAITSKRTKD